MIARDRSEIYAEGGRRGAQTQLQVADRWHLLRNLGDAVEHFLMRRHKQLEATAGALAAEASESSKPRALPAPLPSLRRLCEAADQSGGEEAADARAQEGAL